MVLFQVRRLDENGANPDSSGPNKTAEAPAGRTEAPGKTREEPEEDGAWPASLRRYLQRAFDNCTKKQGSRQHGQLEKVLHRIVTDAMADNRMLTTDWDNEPLPRYNIILVS